MTNKLTTVQKEIERLVNKYSRESKELFRAELEYLVALAERDQMRADHETIMKTLGRK